MQSLPAIVAGPILRHCSVKQVNFWLVTTLPYTFSCTFKDADTEDVLYQSALTDDNVKQVQVGTNAFINLITITLEHALPLQRIIAYDLELNHKSESHHLTELIPDLVYGKHELPTFVLKSKIDNMLHGSCRKPHYDSGDGLQQIDAQLKAKIDSVDERPAMIMMSGDQVYCDDVAGPTLSAIMQVSRILGLFDETWQHDDDTVEQITSTELLFNSRQCFYQRHEFLPHDSVTPTIFDKFFSATKRPIFTSVNAKNHLVTLSEVLSMYFLVWSPTLWSLVDIEKTDRIPQESLALYNTEMLVVNRFVDGLADVRRALAHIPVYMIFDDHDITDDWNLTRGWEEAAYKHPFSKRIIGNALAGYFFCQGWGNAPENVAPITENLSQHFSASGITNQDEFINQLLAFDHWHYHLLTSPKVVVLDTRTQRWRSESNAGKPSGLMDWESLTALQQELLNEPSVIMVTAAPIYGVKLIETVQRVFTFFGKPLVVDAENWMAHSGTANVMLNIFRHHKTPPNFIILSGDVHYSFVYEVNHRFIRTSSRILQVTCSGVKNEFPPKLLHILERLNRYLYWRYSPLNWFTKRRRMKIRERKPSITKDDSIYNGSGIGRLRFSEDNETILTDVITPTGEIVSFESKTTANDFEQ